MPEYISSGEKELTQKKVEIPLEILQEAYKKFETQQEQSRQFQRLGELQQHHALRHEVPLYHEHFDERRR